MFSLGAFLMDVCEEVADVAHVELSGIVRVLGTRSKPRVRSRADGLAKSGQFSIDKRMPKAYQILNDCFWRRAQLVSATL